MAIAIEPPSLSYLNVKLLDKNAFDSSNIFIVAIQRILQLIALIDLIILKH